MPTETLTSIVLQAKLTAALGLQLDSGARTPSANQGLNVTPNTTLAEGTGAGQANFIWSSGYDSTWRTVSASGSEDLDVYDLAAFDIGAGAGKDAHGQAVALNEIVGLLLHVKPDSVGTMLVGGEGTGSAWNSIFNGSDTAQLGPFGADGLCLLFNPPASAWAVADTSNHLLTIAEPSGAGDLQYRVVLLGRQ